MIRALGRVLDPSGRRVLRLQVAFIVAFAVLQGVAFVLLVPVLSALLEGRDGAVAGWLAVLCGVAIAAGVCFYAQALLGHRLGTEVARTLHRRLGDHLARLPLGWYGPERVGELGRMASQGVTEVMSSAAHLIRPLVAAMVTPLTVVAAMFIIDWRLALATAATAPAIYAAHRWSGYLARKAAVAVQSSAAEASGRIVEFAGAQGVLRAFGRADQRTRWVDGALEAQYRARKRQLWDMSIGLVASSIAVQAAFLIVMVVGVELALGGSVEVAHLVALLVLVARFGQPLVEAADIVGALRSARGSLRGIERVLAIDPMAEPDSPTLPADASIRLEGVHFGYGDHRVLRGIDLDIPAGSTLAIVGPSGSGKTTLARLIARFWDVDSGAVRLGGVDVRQVGTAGVMAMVAPVFQDVYLFDATIEENIRAGRPDAGPDQVRAAARAARVDEIVARLPQGWETPVGEGGAALSGGERQRVSIARAILKDAPIVLLDEATAALDPENESAVQEALATLSAGRTTVVIAHRLATVVGADRIAVVDGGVVAESGTHAQLMELDGRYAAFWRERNRARGWRIGARGPSR